MKIMEMSFMLLALFFFFMLVGMFFLVFYSSELKKQANDLYKEGTINTLVGLADTPEFSCGESACVDMDKVEALRERIRSSGGTSPYYNFWNIGSLKVVRVYPSDPTEEIVLKAKNAGTNENLEWAFVSLCRKEIRNGYSYDKCEIGRIIAGTEEIQ